MSLRILLALVMSGLLASCGTTVPSMITTPSTVSTGASAAPTPIVTPVSQIATGGTSTGAMRLSIIKDMRKSGTGKLQFSDFIVLKGGIYFRTNSDKDGTNLWKTDGTESGTVLVKNISRPWSQFSWWSLIEGRPFSVINNNLYFMSDGTTSAAELWKSDGTEQGTVMIKNIDECLFWMGDFPIERSIAYNDMLYFEVCSKWKDKQTIISLWKTDGTDTGTNKILDLSGKSDLVVFKNALYFGKGTSLWKMDGTDNGITKVGNIGGGLSFFGATFTIFHDALYFQSQGNKNESWYLWKTDGTGSGMTVVDNSGSIDGQWVAYNDIITTSNALYFTKYNDDNRPYLWKTDGIESKLMIGNNGNWIGGFIGDFYSFDDTLYFRLRSNGTTQFWKIEGTILDTVALKDMNYKGEDRDIHWYGNVFLNNTVYINRTFALTILIKYQAHIFDVGFL